MRVYDNGCMFTVACSETDVQAFAERWPCFGKVKALWFCFDKRNGDLVDTNQTDDAQDNAGVLALSEDAKEYGIRQLKLPLSWEVHLPHYPINDMHALERAARRKD